jgi:hypothetical protein
MAESLQMAGVISLPLGAHIRDDEQVRLFVEIKVQLEKKLLYKSERVKKLIQIVFMNSCMRAESLKTSGVFSLPIWTHIRAQQTGLIV